MTQVIRGLAPLPVPEHDSLLSRMWERGATAGGPPIAFHADEQGDGWTGLTWQQLRDRVRSVAAGLVASGVEPGDRVALMARTRLEWSVADYAILAAGAVTVPIYETSSVEQCAWILSDSQAKLAFAGGADHAKTLDRARDQAPDLRDIAVFDDGGLDRLADQGDEAAAREVDRRVTALTLADPASVIYTSGTTGRPKGCLLSHRNLLYTARQAPLYLGEFLTPQDSTLLFLPLAHVFARIIQFAVYESATPVAYARSVETLSEDLNTFHPTFLLAVPRVFEKMFASAQRKAEGPKRRVFDLAVAHAQRWADTPAPGLALRVQHALFDRLVFAKLRAALGGKLRYCISGGAALAPHLTRFFSAAGLTILEGYGLTETSAGTCCNSPKDNRMGTVGRPTPGFEVRLGGDSELLLRGPGVFTGYLGNEQATLDVFADDGWFRTGDLAEVDDGFVRITGRKKEILVTAGGKNVAPAMLEEQLKAHRLVSAAMVVGDGRPFIGALVTLDPDELALFAKERNLSGSPAELRDSALVREELDAAVAAVNQTVSRPESIRRIAVLERDFDAEHDEMTPTLKLRRRVIAEHFAEAIEGLYAANLSG